MSWRVIAVSNPARLSVANKQLVIEQDEKFTIPIEDINTLVIDSYGVMASCDVFSELTSQKVTVIFCDSKHLPCSTLLPYEPHSRQLKTTRSQLLLSEPFKKRLWQLIVKQKIRNQAAVLSFLDGHGNTVDSIADLVKSGDSDNREGYAAQLYFAQIFESGVSRSTQNRLNSAFDYGYSIVRSLIARQIASYGLLSSLGIHHKSELNNFNLADDFIEPYRPIIDYYTLTEIGGSSLEGELSKSDRAKIIDVLNKRVIIEAKQHTVKYSVELMIKSFSRCCEVGEFEYILLPSVTKTNDKQVYENDGDVRFTGINEEE